MAKDLIPKVWKDEKPWDLCGRLKDKLIEWQKLCERLRRFRLHPGGLEPKAYEVEEVRKYATPEQLIHVFGEESVHEERALPVRA